MHLSSTPSSGTSQWEPDSNLDGSMKTTEVGNDKLGLGLQFFCLDLRSQWKIMIHELSLGRVVPAATTS